MTTTIGNFLVQIGVLWILLSHPASPFSVVDQPIGPITGSGHLEIPTPAPGGSGPVNVPGNPTGGRYDPSTGPNPPQQNSPPQRP